MALLVMSACGGSGDSDTTTATPDTPAVTPAPVVDKYASVPTPTATLVPTGTIGGADRNYPFFAMDINLGKLGYVEQEFFIEGKANTYDTPAQVGGVGNGNTTAGATANILTKDNPYKTRLVVYRPIDPAKFNGTTIVEWQNVSNGYDTPVQWFQQKDWVIRNGYAFVEVSAQSASITNATTGLKVWSPSRYGTLDVTNGGKVTGDLLSYDIFSQAAKAIRAVPAVMGGLTTKKMIAVGNSQSAGRLGIYLNGLQPLHGIYDGALIVIGGGVIRTDLTIPVVKTLSESEIGGAMTNENAVLQADSAKFVTWQIAGASHSEIYGAAVRGTMLLRDLNRTIGEVGGVATRSRIASRYVQNSAIDKIEKYIDKGTPLPKATPMVVTDASVPSVARDADGNVLGGLRLPDLNVPIATDVGYVNFPGVTAYIGGHIPFTKARLDALYPNHYDYVQKFTSAANSAVAAGYMLDQDAQEAITNAQASIIGEGLTCDATAPLCQDISQFPMRPSILTLRMQLYVYNVTDRAALLAPIDDATRQIATGYLIANTGTRTAATLARPYFQKAIASLQTYIPLVTAQATTAKSISQATADYLVSQANTMITELGKL